MQPLPPSTSPSPTTSPTPASDRSAAPPRQPAGQPAGNPNRQPAGNTPLRRLAGLFPNRATTPLAAGTTIVYRGSDSSEADLQAAGLGRTSSITFNQGWNIFTPAPDAIGLSERDFARTPGGGNSVFFDPRLIDCDRLAGVLVIYTYDQTDTRANNGFRIALPCHPQLAATLDTPAIDSIDSNDSIYAYFFSTTPVTLTFQDGRYTPA